MFKDQSKESRDSPLNELAASIASKLARNTSAPSDTLQAEASALAEDSFTLKSERLDEVPAPKQLASQMSHDQLPSAKPTSGEYRTRADACLSWAGEASTDEVRLACLTLANAWLKAAIGEDEGAGT